MSNIRISLLQFSLYFRQTVEPETPLLILDLIPILYKQV
jgi:hypothetical protein